MLHKHSELGDLLNVVKSIPHVPSVGFIWSSQTFPGFTVVLWQNNVQDNKYLSTISLQILLYMSKSARELETTTATQTIMFQTANNGGKQLVKQNPGLQNREL